MESPQVAGARLEQIVTGVDGSPESLHALEVAASVGSPHDTFLTIVHVRSRPPGLPFSVAGATEYEHAEAQLDDLVQDAVERILDGYPGGWTITNRRGNVVQELLTVAEDVDADMIVVGHRSHGPIRDAILGSVAAGTVHRSNRTVIVAIPRPDDSGGSDD